MDRREFLVLMASSVFAPPPTNFEPVDSPAFRKWFADVSTKLNGTFKIPNPYTDQIAVVGTYNGIGQVYVDQTQATGPDIWAGFFKSVGTSGYVNNTIVAIGAQGYSLTGANSTTIPNVWGIATEAWTGAHNIEPTGSAVLQNELSVISQYHDNAAAIVGLNVPFKNRADTLYSGAVLHGTSGGNKFNKNSRAIQIDSQPRSTAGEFCGWNIGILFSSTALDESVDGLAVGIDFINVDPSILESAIALAEGHRITFEGSKQFYIGMDTGVTQFQVGSGSTVIFGIANDGTGRIYTTSAVVGTATAGGAALPANPYGFWEVDFSGTTYKIPVYNT